MTKWLKALSIALNVFREVLKALEDGKLTPNEIADCFNVGVVAYEEFNKLKNESVNLSLQEGDNNEKEER